MREIRDTTVTIHPTVKTSTVYALELLAESKKVSIGKALEMCLEENREFKEAKGVYYGKIETLSLSLFDSTE